MKLDKKITFGLLAVASLVLGQGIYSYRAVNIARGELDRLTREHIRQVLVTSEMKLATVQVQQFLSDASATGEEGGINEAKEWRSYYMEQAGQFAKFETSPIHLQRLKVMNQDFEAFFNTGVKMAHAYRISRAAGNVVMKTFDTDATKILEKGEVLKQEKIKALKSYSLEIEAKIKRLSQVTVGVVGGVIFVCLLITIFFSRDLKVVSSSLLTAIIKLISEAQKIDNGNQNLSNRTHSQAAALEQTAATLEEVTATVKQTADNSISAFQASSEMVESVADGSRILDKAHDAMNAISDSSNKISDIVILVEEIAFQTNILAINAAIEAAKAGENGKGFAVVAIEVRDLAERSSDAAKEISYLIRTSIQKVGDGTILVEESVSKFKKISEGAKNVVGAAESIKVASKEQHIAIEQINQAVLQIDTVTQENSQLVTSLSQISSALSQQVKSINEQISSNFSARVG